MRIAVIVILILTWSLPGFGNSYLEEQRADAVQTQIENQIPFNAPSEDPYSVVVFAKVHFIDLSFLPQQILDLPGQETVNNQAILQNSYQYNVFYVQITTKAP